MSEAIIRVRLLTEEEGGRKGDIEEQKYSCPLFSNGKAYDCRFVKSVAFKYQLGKVYEIPVKFLRPDLVMEKLYIVAKISLWEGETIGEGERLKLL